MLWKMRGLLESAFHADDKCWVLKTWVEILSTKFWDYTFVAFTWILQIGEYQAVDFICCYEMRTRHLQMWPLGTTRISTLIDWNPEIEILWFYIIAHSIFSSMPAGITYITILLWFSMKKKKKNILKIETKSNESGGVLAANANDWPLLIYKYWTWSRANHIS